MPWQKKKESGPRNRDNSFRFLNLRDSLLIALAPSRISPPAAMIQDYLDTANEISIGGFHFQLVVAVNDTLQCWERVNDDVDDKAPVEGAQGKWKLVETTGTGVKHV